MNARNWYNQTTEFLQDTFGTDYKLVAALLSATSPQVRLSTSWTWTLRIYYQAKAGKHPDLSKLGPCHKANVFRALAGEPLSGRKVSNFYENLIGNENAVTLDTWMLRLFGWYTRHIRVPTDQQYDRLAVRFANVARGNGFSPAEFQAILWTKYRLQNGEKPASYCIAGQDKKQMIFDY